ncbi:ester cyclase [Taibaiella soli]|nr:ester cyclase [Taibaiella soli]
MSTISDAQHVDEQNEDIPIVKSITVDRTLTKQQSDEMIAIARNFYAFWNTGKEEYLRASVSENFFDNTLPNGRPQGFKGILFASANFRKSVPDLHCSMEDLIITGDKIVCRQIYTGHNTGPTAGHPASGNTIEFFAIDILHVRNGKVYEDWHLEDNLTFLQEAGVVKLK